MSVYADDIFIYASRHYSAESSESLNSVDVFSFDLRLSINAAKFEVFKYLSVVFDQGLIWNAHTKYFMKKCKTRINFMKFIAKAF
jgi:hypothetical protein